MGNAEDAHKDQDGHIHNASKITRNENKWQSNVFGEPKPEESKRRLLNQTDKGREGLFGDSMEKDAYQKKTNLAAAISQKESTRPPVFDERAADERKNRELYGNSNYEPVKRVMARDFVPAQTGMDAVLDRNTKGKLANHLASNVLSNDD